MITVGIDPGRTGGVALVSPTGDLVDACRVDFGGASDLRAATSFLTGLGPMQVFIERPFANPRNGAPNVLAQGAIYGAARALAMLSAGAVFDVAPAEWKRSQGVPADKRATVEVATARFGAHAAARYWPRAGDNGVAEAALIALHGLHLLGARL